MPRRRGQAGGPGAASMGGVGARPRVPPTAMAGRGAGAPPPAAAGMLGPMPGGQPRPGAGGGMGGAPGFKRGGHVSEEKEESIMEKKRERHEALARGGPVRFHEGHKPLDYPRKSSKADSQTRQSERDHKPRSAHAEKEKQITEGKAGFQRGGAPGIGKAPSISRSAFERGGYVETTSPRSAPGRGIDTKPRVGRDTGKGVHGD